MSGPAPGYAVALTGVAHRFAGVPALDGIDLTVPAGEIVAVVGPSGAGKSTLLALLDGRLQGWHGGALVLGRALSPRRTLPREARAETGFVFQEYALVERATVRQNVRNGRLGKTNVIRSLFGRFSDRDEAAVGAALGDAGISELADRRVDRLSGGQRQRVAIARCLAQEPKLILADEPVASLDPVNAERMLELLARVSRARGAALIFSSHQPDLAARHAGRVVALRAGRVAFDDRASALDDAAVNAIYGTTDLAPGKLRLVS